MPELTMPRLSDTMQEGTIARWLKQPGQRFAPGEALAEIETDKATMPLEAYEPGVLERILVPEGQTVPIGRPIALYRAEGEAPGMDGARAEEAAAAPAPAPPGAARPAAGARPAPPSPPPGAEGPVKASPMARALARERRLDLRTVRGSGPGGRVIRADVEAALAVRPAVEAGPSPPEAPVEARAIPVPPRPPAAAETEAEEVPLSSIRRVLARRMSESFQTAPHIFLTMVVDAERLVALRAELKRSLEAAGEPPVTLNDLLIRACALSLRANPDLNVSFAGDKLLRFRRIHIAFAVALENGLVAPVVRDADQKSARQIAAEARQLIEKARAGKLAPAEVSGSTFTLSNLGMYGIDHFTAILNPPEAAILAVGAAAPEPVVRDGQVVVRHTLKLTLSCDHRAVDGAAGARFLQHLKGLLEDPLRIVV